MILVTHVAHVFTRQGPYKREAGESEAEEDVTTGAEVRVMPPQAKECKCLKLLEKAMDQILPCSLQRKHGPADTLILAQGTHFGLLTSRTMRC